MHVSALAVRHRARWESPPDTIRTHVPIQRVVIADPILDLINDGIGIHPLDVDCIDRPGGPHVGYDPLWVPGVAFTRKMAGQVRIALPISLKTGDQGLVAAGHEIAMRQR